MEQHDEHIKKILEKRSIQPSSTSWDRLEGMLDANEEISPVNKYVYYSIAASIMVLLGSVMFFINSNSSTIDEVQTVVETDNNVIIKSSDFIKTTTDEDSQASTNEFIIVENSLSNINNIENRNTEGSIKKLSPVKIAQNQFAPKLNNKPLKSIEQKTLVAHEDTVRNESSIVETLADTGNNDLDNEVDMLLALATQELRQETTKEISNKSAITVDPDALLADVEQELDLSFKANVFNKLKRGFQKTKTAVVKRNEN
ncbi:MAG: hypothetical protein ACPGU9_07460 [Flavobacteriaceae bacterium]